VYSDLQEFLRWDSRREGATMHKLLSTVAVFAFAGTLFGQGPFVGTWKLDTAKTKFTAADLGKNVTVIIEQQGGNLGVTTAATGAEGSPYSLKYTVPLKGGVGQLRESRCRRGSISPTPTCSRSSKALLPLRRVSGKPVCREHAVLLQFKPCSVGTGRDPESRT
jgi:hypothetical protein